MPRLSTAYVLAAVLCGLAPLTTEAQGLPDGADRALVDGVCTACHPVNQITGSSGYTQEGWKELAGTMIDLSKTPEEQKKASRSRDVFGFWQGLLRVVGSFGDCPRCLAVCPVGNDYHAHLADIQKHIPEKTPEKMGKAAEFKKARKEGQTLPGLSEWNIRWVGEKGYQGIVARQLQEFKRKQREHLQAAADSGPDQD